MKLLTFYFIPYLEQFNLMKNSHGTYYCTVIIDTTKDRVVGASTLLMERKFIRGCAWVSKQATLVVCFTSLT